MVKCTPGAFAILLGVSSYHGIDAFAGMKWRRQASSLQMVRTVGIMAMTSFFFDRTARWKQNFLDGYTDSHTHNLCKTFSCHIWESSHFGVVTLRKYIRQSKEFDS